MNDDEFSDAMLGLYAYDTGSVSSGIRDEVLRARVIAELRRGADMKDESFDRLRLARFAREAFLAEERLAQRYGLEDVKSFIRWMSDFMGYDL
jgi:hypothetical protein